MSKSLSRTEEELMNVLWQQSRARMRDLLDAYPEPKPAATTLATLLKRMQDKGFVGFDVDGRSRIYFPLVKKNAYFSDHLNGLIKNFFENSTGQFASFFARETNLSRQQLEELRKIIDDEIEQK